MRFLDILHLTATVIKGHRLRAFLTMLGVAIGTASVILLTSIGEGMHDFIAQQFNQFGTNILLVRPGKTQTFGMPGIITTTRKLTVGDAQAVERLYGIERVVPICFGSGRVEYENRGRSVFIVGTTSAAPVVWKFKVSSGSFIPTGDPRRGAPVTVLGAKLKEELFGSENALGKYVRIGGRRFQVIGVMSQKGDILGLDVDDRAYIPVALAMKLFNKEELQEIDVVFSTAVLGETLRSSIEKTIGTRHDGHQDFTIITQAEMLSTLDNILKFITMGVGAIAAISLLVGTIGILTMMWISVNERISEIGLEKAIGAEPVQIMLLFLVEAAFLSTAGGAVGVMVGIGVAQLIHLFVPALPVQIPLPYVALALSVSLAAGLISGVAPARRAARLDPLEALRTE